MERYSRDDAGEREPLDSSHNRPDHNYRPDPAYYDTSPRHQGIAMLPNNEPGRWDNRGDDINVAPAPPQHGNPGYYTRTNETGYANREILSNITPGADNFGESAAGGMAGIAHSVAERNARESGLRSLRTTGQVLPPPSRSHYSNNHQHDHDHDPAFIAGHPIEPSRGPGQGGLYPDSNSSLSALGVSAASQGSRSPSRDPSTFSGREHYADQYQGYYSTPRNGDYSLGAVDPNDILDDGDDGLVYSKHSQRNSMLSVSQSDRGPRNAIGLAATGGGVGGIFGRKGYNSGTPPEYDLSTGREKNSNGLLRKQAKSKKWKWVVIVVVIFLIIGGIIGGVVGGLLNGNKHNGKAQDNGQSAEDDSTKNGDLDINSKEIQALLNNPNLHKVFPGMDYTPINTQYPDCLHFPPSQNNVTRDVAVLSQLTNKIRLYGTDCNQTQMAIHAVRQLKMTSDIKIWMGVWQNNNETTNARQLKQMWDILDEFGDDPFEGIIVANEILFRKEMTIDQLGTVLDGVRTNLSDRGLQLPVATSDLGNDWTSALAKDSDYIMANIHPFFSGTPASEAAEWTNEFWENNNGQFFKSNKSRNIISETGWPTSGGTACPPGGPDTCQNGAVAGVDELNRFMEDWVCSSLKNGTQYFWFEAFDEPWKIRYNEKGKNWEDQWGLLDVNRNLKDGVKIPNCGGKGVS